MSKNIKELSVIAHNMRLKIIDMAFAAKQAHLGGALSIVEILAALYCGEVLKYDVKNPYDDNRDRLILSKGHGAMALYAALNQVGFISDEDLRGYHTIGHFLQVHPAENIVKGIETSGGSLGQGLSLGAGVALALKLKKNLTSRVYVILGDGECNEGSVWEATAFAAHYGLSNLTVVVDKNGLQLDGTTDEVMSMSPMAEKWQSFGWTVIETDGHDFESLLSAFTKEINKPKAIIANTVKGKGVSFMENNKAWHYSEFTPKQYGAAVAEMGEMKI